MQIFLLFMVNFGIVLSKKKATDPPALFKDLVKYKDARSLSDYVFWPNATIPFYINESNFDLEQTNQILRVLHEFKTVTCLKFVPVVASPLPNHEVMVFQNPHGERLCNIRDMGRPRDQPQIIELGYKCLESPRLEMIIMRALGFPFEHNRMMRDIFVEVQKENIMQEYLGLFDKEAALPSDLSNLPYDTSSVLHFDEFEYTKNGHRTIIVRDKSQIPQQKKSLSRLDKRKIQIVYGPECRKRERAEKLEICKVYAPIATRRKRSLDENPSNNNEKDHISNNITHVTDVKNAKDNLKESKTIENANAKPQIVVRANEANEPQAVQASEANQPKIVQANETKESSVEFDVKSKQHEIKTIVDNVDDLLEQALIEARQKHCNATEPYKKPNQTNAVDFKNNTVIAMNVVDFISSQLKVVLKEQLRNLTEFCGKSDEKAVLRVHCLSYNDPRCRNTYFKSTNHNWGRYTTKIRDFVEFSTGHPRTHSKYSRGKRHVSLRNESDVNTVNESDVNTNESDVNTNESDVNIVNETDVKGNTENPDLHQVTWTKVITVDNKTEDIKENGKKWEYNIKRRDVPYLEPYVPESGEMDQPGNRFKVKESEHKQDINEDDTPYNRFKISKNKPSEHKKQYRDEFVDDESQKKQSKEKVDSDSKETMVRLKKGRSKNRHADEIQDRETPKRKPLKRQNNKEESTDERIKKIDESMEKAHKDIEDSNERSHKKIDESFEKTHKRIDGSDEKPKRQKRVKKIKEHVEEKVSIPNMNDLPKVIKLPKENFDFYNERKWKNTTVPYFIEETTKYDIEVLRDNIKEVNDILIEKTCVQLKEIGEGDTNKYPDYLVLDSKQRDYVTGKVGGRQIFGSVELFEGGQHRQFTAMMVMAMLGFYFEVARIDRDKYIRVHARHVRPDKLHHFEKIREGATMPLPYDYASATHPAWQFWRKIGKTGISTVATFKHMDPDGKIMRRLGQNTKLLSDIDIIKINTVYGLKCRQNKKPIRDREEDDSLNE